VGCDKINLSRSAVLTDFLFNRVRSEIASIRKLMEQAKKIFLVFFIFAMLRHFWPDAVSFLKTESKYLPARIDQAYELFKTKF